MAIDRGLRLVASELADVTKPVACAGLLQGGPCMRH